MNFFKLYIGDYQRDTAHLSVTEHGAYMLMLQHYYATEKPLPIGKALHRMLRAQEKVERDAIDTVAQQFWRTTPDGLVNDRADEEIAKACSQAETNRRIATSREAKRKAQRTEHDSCNEQSTNRATNDQPNHSQTPDTRHQTPEGIQAASPPPARKRARPLEEPQALASPPVTVSAMTTAGVDPQHAADWLAIRKAKRLPLTPTAWAETQAEAAKAGVPVAEAIRASAANGWAGFRAAWLANRDAPNGPNGSRPLNRQLAVEAENRRVLSEWLGQPPQEQPQ